ncbi:MAG TPA: aspartate--ammonia ligase [Firmicutes bacterium]|nr:aspartate--ammonia ligase [Bacillota bacterium]
MYRAKLDLIRTERAIKEVKDTFEALLAKALNLSRISAPLFVPSGSGLNDNLNGVERPVSFDLKSTGARAEVVQSLAKWKRYALAKYGFEPHSGLYCDMNAIRRDEEMDALHSVYVDQWDWEAVILREDRTRAYLESTVKKIYAALYAAAETLRKDYPVLENYFSEDITFVTTQELEDAYPALSPKERECVFTQEHGSAFVMQIGGKMRSGFRHDGRSPDYDDWTLNGDIVAWYPPLGCAFELSSMGIRVDEAALISQLTESGCLDRLNLPFHRALAEGELPLTMGGGIGQSRLCMFLLNKAHIGEVQVSVWDEKTLDYCRSEGIELM